MRDMFTVVGAGVATFDKATDEVLTVDIDWDETILTDEEDANEPWEEWDE